MRRADVGGLLVYRVGARRLPKRKKKSPSPHNEDPVWSLLTQDC